MAQDDRFDLARLERLERRLQALEDAEAIRNLKARYAALCDAQYDADGIAMLFTEDALWESPGLGRFEGREAIRGFFRGARGFSRSQSITASMARSRWKATRPKRDGTCLYLARWPREIRRCGVPASITRLTRGWMELGCSATNARSR
jgi:hypothetical protein